MGTQLLKPVIRTPYKRPATVGERFTLPSRTIPDQTMSIPEILRRYASGLSLDSSTPIYEGEEDILDGVDIRTLDLSERQEFIQARQDELEDLSKRLRKTTSKKAQQEPAPSGEEPEPQ